MPPSSDVPSEWFDHADMTPQELSSIRQSRRTPREIYWEQVTKHARYAGMSVVGVYFLGGLPTTSMALVQVLVVFTVLGLSMFMVMEVVSLLLFLAMWWAASHGRGGNGGVGVPSAPIMPRTPMGVR